jgi:hypothetical protein
MFVTLGIRFTRKSAELSAINVEKWLARSPFPATGTAAASGPHPPSAPLPRPHHRLFPSSSTLTDQGAPCLMATVSLYEAHSLKVKVTGLSTPRRTRLSERETAARTGSRRI